MKNFITDIQYYPGRRWPGYSAVFIRLFFGLIIVLPFFLLLAALAHIKLDWFTPIRQFYFLLGIPAGIFIGYIEAYYVTRRLLKEYEVVAWVLLPLGLVVWVLPFVYIDLFIGSSEVLPFCIYFFSPSFTIALVTTGFLFRRFEKREQVRIYTSFVTWDRWFGFYPKYWIETLENLKVELYGLLDSVAEKDTARLQDYLWMLSYGRYAERLRELVIRLSENRGKDGRNISQIRELITRLLDELIKFNRTHQSMTRIFFGDFFLWIVLMIYGAANNFFGIPHGDLLLFLSFLLIFIYVAIKRKIATKAYEKAIQPILEGIDLKTQTIIREILELGNDEESFR